MDRITAVWADQKMLREIMVFLGTSTDVGTARAVRNCARPTAPMLCMDISQNPYRLARDIRRIGFRTADLIS